MHLRPIKEHYSSLHPCENKAGKLHMPPSPSPLFESSTLGRRNKILILDHKSKVIFQGLKISLFLNYNSALLWHWKAFMTAIKVR